MLPPLDVVADSTLHSPEYLILPPDEACARSAPLQASVMDAPEEASTDALADAFCVEVIEPAEEAEAVSDSSHESFILALEVAVALAFCESSASTFIFPAEVASQLSVPACPLSFILADEEA